jgi:hypothetical protein
VWVWIEGVDVDELALAELLDGLALLLLDEA